MFNLCMLVCGVVMMSKGAGYSGYSLWVGVFERK